MVKQTSLILAAAWALLILMAPPVHALTLHSTALDKTVSNRSSGPDVHDLDREFTEILSLGDKDPCLKKCTTEHTRQVRAAAAGGLGRGASFASGQLLAAALLGVAGGGHSNNGSDSGFDFGADYKSLQRTTEHQFRPPRFQPPYHFLHLASVRWGCWAGGESARPERMPQRPN